MRHATFASLACFVLGTAAIIGGSRLVVRDPGQTTGSLMSRVLVATGIIGLLAALGFASEVYER